MASKAGFQSMLAGRQTTAARRHDSGGLSCVPWTRMAADTADWDRLAEDAAEPNPFFESWYLLPSLKALDGKGEVSILRFERDGCLRGLIPIVRRRRYYGWPLPNMANWIHPNCFVGTPLVAKGAEHDFWRALIDWTDAHPGSALFLHLTEVSLEGRLHGALKTVLAETGRHWATVHQEQRAHLASDLDPGAYLEATLSPRKRKDLRRRFNRLGELGKASFVRETGSASLTEWIEQFLALEASGWKGENGSALASDPATAALFRESLEGAARRGKLERLSLELNNRPIAMLATFVAPPGAFGYKTTFDETFAQYLPGVLLEREFLAMLDRPDIEWCDSCAAADHSVMNQIWGERRAVGRVSIAIGGPLRRAAFSQLLRRELARQPTGTQS